jgi:hypothetical protein
MTVPSTDRVAPGWGWTVSFFSVPDPFLFDGRPFRFFEVADGRTSL